MCFRVGGIPRRCPLGGIDDMVQGNLGFEIKLFFFCKRCTHSQRENFNSILKRDAVTRYIPNS